MIKSLLIITAVFEVLTGLALLASPSRAGVSLTGSPIDSAAGVIVARVAGAALLAIGVACWLARDHGHSRRRPGPHRGAADLQSWQPLRFWGSPGSHRRQTDAAIWPGTAAHAGLAVFCIVALTLG